MAFTLNDLLIGAYRRGGLLKTAQTSSGGSSLLVPSSDASSGIAGTADDEFNNGTLFIVSGGSSSLDGTFYRIDDFAATSGIFTPAGGMSTAMTSNVTIGYTTPRFRTDHMIELANDALGSVGTLVFIDRAIQSSGNQQVYNLSTAAKYSRPIRVDIMGRTGSSVNDPEWKQISNWEIQPSTAGGTNLLIFGNQPTINRDVRVWYEDRHHRITGSTSPVDERIHPELAIALLVERMLEWWNSKIQGSSPFDIQRWNDAKNEAQTMRVRYPIWKQNKKPKILAIGNQRAFDRDKPPLPPPWGPS